MSNTFIGAWRDFDGDKQQVSYPVKATSLNAGNFSSFISSIESWQSALGAGGGFYSEMAVDPGGSASSPASQFSLQAIMELKDAVTGVIFHKRIPAPDLAKAADGGTNPAYIVSGGLTTLNPVHADYITMKNQVETHMESPDGNAVLLNRVYIEE